MQGRPGKGSAHSMPTETQGWLTDPGGQSSLTADEQGQQLCVIRAKVATPSVLPNMCSALHRSQKLRGQECFVKEKQSTPSLS